MLLTLGVTILILLSNSSIFLSGRGGGLVTWTATILSNFIGFFCLTFLQLFVVLELY